MTTTTGTLRSLPVFRCDRLRALVTIRGCAARYKAHTSTGSKEAGYSPCSGCPTGHTNNGGKEPPIVACRECGIPIRRNAPAQKFCAPCAKARGGYATTPPATTCELCKGPIPVPHPNRFRCPPCRQAANKHRAAVREKAIRVRGPSVYPPRLPCARART